MMLTAVPLMRGGGVALRPCGRARFLRLDHMNLDHHAEMAGVPADARFGHGRSPARCGCWGQRAEVDGPAGTVGTLGSEQKIARPVVTTPAVRVSGPTWKISSRKLVMRTIGCQDIAATGS